MFLYRMSHFSGYSHQGLPLYTAKELDNAHVPGFRLVLFTPSLDGQAKVHSELPSITSSSALTDLALHGPLKAVFVLIEWAIRTYEDINTMNYLLACTLHLYPTTNCARQRVIRIL